MEAVAQYAPDSFETPTLSFEAWRELFKTTCGRYNPEGVEPAAFSGCIRRGNVFGFTTLNLTSNTSTLRRGPGDVRSDGVDQYFVVFQIAGKAMLVDHNDQAARLAPGKVLFVDGARPMTSLADASSDTWNNVSINLPRKELVYHLGFEPQGGLCRPSATPSGRLLLDLIQNSSRVEGLASSGDPYTQLIIYDIVGALFAPSDPGPVSRQTDKLFARIAAVIRENFADPAFGPAQTAAKAGISLRYLHKLFMERGLTCREYIYSRRLDYAAHLLRRRASITTDRPLGDIAYACGFGDYAHFSRKFRHRYGRTPGAYSARENAGDSETTDAD
jgi:AraC family transcriptional regulator, positive regulator of tynA and feaB